MEDAERLMWLVGLIAYAGVLSIPVIGFILWTGRKRRGQ